MRDTGHSHGAMTGRTRANMGPTTGVLVLAAVLWTSGAHAQQWSLGGTMGISSFGGYAGFQVTPAAELLLNRTVGVGSEFSFNTQYGVPILWYPYFKYYVRFRTTPVRPYASAGPVMILNVPNAPYFGILFGGGVNIPVARRLYLAPDVVMGPVFGVGGRTYNLFLYGNYYGMGVYGATSYTVGGGTIFTFAARVALRYEL